ncbi:MAG TPA: lipid A-modifier LpxR family protein [Thermoanaerobaculia bacterium]|nr:lipid A-modifier LpxR family protein [Thermoanaerobaculia bacterium]
MNHTRLAAIAIALVIALVSATAAFAQEHAAPVRPAGGDLAMVRFEFDNDTWLGSDDAFTAGWSLQYHSAVKQRTNGRAVRWSAGIGQLMSTPEDLTVTALQPEAAPYAGVLGVHGSWASYDNRHLHALQLYAGCMGPCSYAEEVQKFVHEDMHAGTPPQGWDNQLDQQWLGNVNYAWRYKLIAAPENRYWSRRWAHDLSAGGQVAAGNAFRFMEGQVEYRVGWGLPGGFTHIPDPAPRGVIVDPVYLPARASTSASLWRGYASVVLRAAAIDKNRVVEGGRTANGGHHPGLDVNDPPEIVAGLHVARGAYAAHLNYYRLLGDSEDYGGRMDWINVSVERRF